MDWLDWEAKIWAINRVTVSLRTGRLIDHAGRDGFASTAVFFGRFGDEGGTRYRRVGILKKIISYKDIVR
jgi:hypothetical protein